MSELVLHGVSRSTVHARRQLGVLFESGRVWLLIAVCVAPLFRIGVIRARLWNEHFNPAWPSVITGDYRFALVYVAMAWALYTWRGEIWGQRDYQWSLPVRRSAGDLWRVASGAFWLLSAIAINVVAGTLLDTVNGIDGPLPAAPFWINLFTMPLVVYLIFSVPALAARRPLAWAIGMFVVPFAIMLGALALDLTVIQRAWEFVAEGSYGWKQMLEGGHWLAMRELAAINNEQVRIVLREHSLQNWIGATLLWGSLAIAGLWIASRRRQ